MTVFNLVSNRALCDSDDLSPGYAGPRFQAPGITPFADDPHVGWCSAGATFPPRAWLFGPSPSNTQDWMMVGCPAPRLVMGGMTSTMSWPMWPSHHVRLGNLDDNTRLRIGALNSSQRRACAASENDGRQPRRSWRDARSYKEENERERESLRGRERVSERESLRERARV